MQIPMLVERIAHNGYRAKTGEPLALSVEAATREEAVARLRSELASRLQDDTELVAIEVPARPNPWLAIAGTVDSTDPLIDEWKQAMAAYRDEVDQDPNVR